MEHKAFAKADERQKNDTTSRSTPNNKQNIHIRFRLANCEYSFREVYSSSDILTPHCLVLFTGNRKT